MPDETSSEITHRLTDSVATACRVMAAVGLVENILGHISARISAGELVVRCRGPREAGLAFTVAADVRPARLTTPGGADLDGSGWTTPNELPIHTEIMRRRPAVTAVVHAHPPALVTFSLLDAPLLPIYGAYDMPGARLAADGIPVWERAVLINNDELAGAMADALGDRPVVLLRGHGLVSVAEGDPETALRRAVLQAVAVDTLARTTLTIRQAGGVPRALSDEDLAALPDLGGRFNVDTMWRYLLTRLPATA